MIEWSDSYLVGIERIDLEHKVFLNLVRDFEKSILEKRDKATLLNILEEITLYAKFHFRSEENLMASIGYPNLAAHRDIHYRLIDVLNNKETALSMGIIEPTEILRFLVDWFVQHTTSEDRKIGVFHRVHPA